VSPREFPLLNICNLIHKHLFSVFSPENNVKGVPQGPLPPCYSGLRVQGNVLTKDHISVEKGSSNGTLRGEPSLAKRGFSPPASFPSPLLQASNILPGPPPLPELHQLSWDAVFLSPHFFIICPMIHTKINNIRDHHTSNH